MKLIIINKHGEHKAIGLYSFLGIFSIMFFALVPLVIGIAIGTHKTESWPEYYDKLAQGVREENLKGIEQIESLEREVANKILALNANVGMMKSELIRLNAIAEKIIIKFGIEAEEFDFSEIPSVGGANEEAIPLTSEAMNLNLLNNIYQTKVKLATNLVQFEIINDLVVSDYDSKERKVGGFPAAYGWLSSRYGMRTDPFSGRRVFHKGVDIAGREGDPVLSIAKGIVVRVAKKRGYGYVVDIKHGNGYMTRYAHNNTVVVQQGDVVNKGQKIAKIGSTGRSTGPHIHLEVLYNSKHIDPLDFLYRHR